MQYVRFKQVWIIYRSNRENVRADALSRCLQPAEESEAGISTGSYYLNTGDLVSEQQQKDGWIRYIFS